MADEKPMTDAEIESAFREADRFTKLLSAFSSVRDVANRHVKMKQEIAKMQELETAYKDSIAKFKSVETALTKLPGEYTEKRAQLDVEHRKRMSDLKAEFDATVKQERMDSEAQIAGFKQKIADFKAQAEKAASDLEAIRATHSDVLNQLTEQIAAKQKQLDSVTKAFADFKKAHAI